MFIHLRNDNNYPFSNIFIIAEWEADAVLQSTDTLEYQMSSPEGKWLGTGFTEVSLYWKQRQRLHDSALHSTPAPCLARNWTSPRHRVNRNLAVGIAAEKGPKQWQSKKRNVQNEITKAPYDCFGDCLALEYS